MLGFLSFSGLTPDQLKRLSNIEIHIPDFGQVLHTSMFLLFEDCAGGLRKKSS